MRGQSSFTIRTFVSIFPLMGNASDVQSSKQLRHLPDFAAYILHHRRDDFLRVARNLLREYDVPLLKKMSIDEGNDLADKSNLELLTSLVEKTPSRHIQNAVERWRTNQFPNVPRNQFVVEDVTRIGHVRKLSFLKMLPFYSRDPDKMIALIGEIDAYILEYTATTLHNFVGIIDDRMHEQLERLKQSEQLYKNAERISHIGNWTWKVSTTDEITWTDELYRIFDLEPQSQTITFTQYLELIHPNDVDTVKTALSGAQVTHAPFEFFHRIITHKGNLKILHMMGEVNINSTGDVLQLVGSAQDVTAIKEAEHILLEQQSILERRTKELQESNASLEEFAYVTSHDLKEHLRKISIFIGLLGESVKWPGEREKDWYDRIAASAIRMRNLIDDLLALSLLSADKRPEANSLDELLDDALVVLENQIDEARAIIHRSHLPNASVIPSQIRQLFQNLLSNALKFSKPGQRPEIHIAHQIRSSENSGENGRAPGNYLEITVSDNGIGFENTHAEKIFAVFQRLHPHNEYEGTGIGLAICRKVVNNHRGTITASAQPGVGAKFTILLPI